MLGKGQRSFDRILRGSHGQHRRETLLLHPAGGYSRCLQTAHHDLLRRAHRERRRTQYLGGPAPCAIDRLADRRDFIDGAQTLQFERRDAKPPPNARPLTAAITGLSRSNRAVIPPKPEAGIV